MRGPELACTAWRRVAVDEPTLWRRLDMAGIPLSSPGWCAVDRSAGQCDALTGCCDDESLLYLAERAPSLRTLHLLCFDGPNKGLEVGLKKFPLLEDLEIELSSGSTPTGNLLGSICQTFPRLKKLRLKFFVSYDYYDSVYDGMLDIETIEAEIPMMSDLYSLELCDCDLTIKGLTAILDSCPLLESLHIIGFFDDADEMDGELQAKCARVKNLILPCDSDGYYESYFPFDEEYY